MSAHTTSGSEVLLGGAVDASPEARPGVPMEWDPPHPAGAAHWREPERQPDPGHVLKRKGLDRLTPVFGTATPPRGLSGVLRRAAYAIVTGSQLLSWLATSNVGPWVGRSSVPVTRMRDHSMNGVVAPTTSR